MSFPEKTNKLTILPRFRGCCRWKKGFHPRAAGVPTKLLGCLQENDKVAGLLKTSSPSCGEQVRPEGHYITWPIKINYTTNFQHRAATLQILPLTTVNPLYGQQTNKRATSIYTKPASLGGSSSLAVFSINLPFPLCSDLVSSFTANNMLHIPVHLKIICSWEQWLVNFIMATADQAACFFLFQFFQLFQLFNFSILVPSHRNLPASAYQVLQF